VTSPQQPYGAPSQGWGGPEPERPTGTNRMAIATLVCGFLCWPLGLVFGSVARSQMRRSGQDGWGLATAGIVVSVIAAAASLLRLVLAVSHGTPG